MVTMGYYISVIIEMRGYTSPNMYSKGGIDP